jgi:HK97 family phage prohead protease/HK97 family phage major capsid protein
MPPLKTKQTPEPDDGESHGDFIDRCVNEMLDEDDSLNEGDAEDACQISWEESRAMKNPRSIPEVMTKTHTGTEDGVEFVLSDQSADRMGDVIMADGWKLANFRRNPVALFAHDPKFIVGRWKDLRIEGLELRGNLELAPQGTSQRIDEIVRLVEGGFLKAVSVGFKPLKYEALDEKDPWGGQRFLEQELVETSLVAVPANANALAIAKGMRISRETLDMVFAESGKESHVVRRSGHTAESGTRNRNGKGKTMSLAQRIQDIEAKLADKKGLLADLWSKVDDSNVKDDEIQQINELRDDIGKLERQHDAMIASEKIVASMVAGDDNNSHQHQHQQRSNGHSNGKSGAVVLYQASGRSEEIKAPAISKTVGTKELEPLDYVIRAAVVAYGAKAWNRSPDEARQMIAKVFPGYDDEPTKGMCEVVLRAASAPAMTTVTGWAAELVQQTYAGLMPALFPKAILSRLAPRGLELTFGQAGKINIPTRSRTPTIAGSFVGEGDPIPVRKGGFTTQSITPKKLGVITTWTREMGVHSTPAIEGLLRQAIQEDTTIAIDTVLIDNGAATLVRPAGLLNGVSAIGATAGSGFTAIVGDLKLLGAALLTGTAANLRTPVLLMNPLDVWSAGFIVAPNTGVFAFKDDLNNGNLNGWPVIDSGTVPAKTIIAVDAADFVTAADGGVRMDVSDQATLHEEDTAPAPLVGGSPAVTASPQRSLWQTDSLALRMVMPLTWLMRRTGCVAWIQNVTW